MQSVSYARHRFPPVIIQHVVWLYLHFTLSYRDVKDLLAERGLDISYETIRRWVLKFGQIYAGKSAASAASPGHCHGNRNRAPSWGSAGGIRHQQRRPKATAP